jgi:hypothetical protein
MDPEAALPPDPPGAAEPPYVIPDEVPDWGPLSEEMLDEWRWIFKGREEGWLAEYVGKHIAVVHQKVVASHENLRELNRILKEELHLDPYEVVTALID